MVQIAGPGFLSSNALLSVPKSTLKDESINHICQTHRELQNTQRIIIVGKLPLF